MLLNSNIRFENHLGPRVIEIFFDAGFAIRAKEDLEELKQAWSANLKKWHSPYTCIFDCRNFAVAPELQADFGRMIAFFQKFFMKKIVGFVEDAAIKPEGIPFEVVTGYEVALAQTSLGKNGGLSRDLSNLRSRIQIDNDFSAHVMEVSFLAPSHFETPEDLRTLREKLQNILMLWHSPYSVVFNVENCTFGENGRAGFAAVERFLKGFFCQSIVGYGTTTTPEDYPFKVYRSRHKAVGTLTNQGLQAGSDANCSTRRSTKSNPAE
jgi:hypothetical protein